MSVHVPIIVDPSRNRGLDHQRFFRVPRTHSIQKFYADVTRTDPSQTLKFMSYSPWPSHGTPTAMITIYHNPRCSKSRGACELVASSHNIGSEPVEIIEYLKQPLSVAQLKTLNTMLGCPVRDMLRDTEAAYEQLGLSASNLSDDQLYEAIANHPELMQRPIVVREGRAVIGRPPERVKALFE
jgi:arsenate reductase